MSIILLSGGSGKRLWPLSNDIRSKQFIKIFKNKAGQYESMLQRMYGSIKRIDSEANVTVATSRMQVPSIKNQIGNDVSISVEPCRRDTFPAVVLACAYLKYVCNVDDDESVIVCPVDPYVDENYFLALQDLDRLAREGKSNLTLMGIEPTYPSEKYGYILPVSSSEVSIVSEFKEKPEEAVAKSYIEKGGLWNAGIFAFKLGYMINRAHELIDFSDYQDLFNRYESLTKISFDYAVVEHEKSIQVKRFRGRWDDLGTWEALTAVMDEKTLGKVTLSDCDNVRVINELDIPVVVMGEKDSVVAVSSEGVLVSSLDASSKIKPIAEKLDNGEIRFAEKSWGRYQVIDVSNTSLTINVELVKGHHMTYHAHHRRDEIWTIVTGEGEVTLNDNTFLVHPGDVIKINLGDKHTIKALTDMKIIEVQIGTDIQASDKIKIN